MIPFLRKREGMKRKKTFRTDRNKNESKAPLQSKTTLCKGMITTGVENTNIISQRTVSPPPYVDAQPSFLRISILHGLQLRLFTCPRDQRVLARITLVVAAGDDLCMSPEANTDAPRRCTLTCGEGPVAISCVLVRELYCKFAKFSSQIQPHMYANGTRRILLTALYPPHSMTYSPSQRIPATKSVVILRLAVLVQKHKHRLRHQVAEVVLENVLVRASLLLFLIPKISTCVSLPEHARCEHERVLICAAHSRGFGRCVLFRAPIFLRTACSRRNGNLPCEISPYGQVENRLRYTGSCIVLPGFHRGVEKCRCLGKATLRFFVGVYSVKAQQMMKMMRDIYSM